MLNMRCDGLLHGIGQLTQGHVQALVTDVEDLARGLFRTGLEHRHHGTGKIAHVDKRPPLLLALERDLCRRSLPAQ